MKIQILSLLSISFIYLSKCQNIITPTNYTLSYLENINMLQMKCKYDSDCPQYSKCKSITDGDQTHSICKFGDFLCPEVTDGYFTNSNVNESCVYVDALMYDLDEETIKEGFSKDIKPILQICSDTLGKCTTEKCNKNSDCFSGMCLNHKCVNGDNLNYEIYRCSADDQAKYFMKCKKVNGMKCGDNSECYSNICTYENSSKYDSQYSKYCTASKYVSKVKKVMRTIFYIIMGIILLLFIISVILACCCS